MPRNFSQRNESTVGTDLFLRLGQCTSVEEVFEDLTKFAVAKGIYLCSIRLTREGLEREFKLPNASAGVGKIKEFTVPEGGRTQLVVRFHEPRDGTVLCELEYAACLAAYRIDLLAGGGLHLGREKMVSADLSQGIDGLIGESKLIRELRQEIINAANIDSSILIIGEPGTGKELVARGIHMAGKRVEKPFIHINCGSINPNLIESDLFGHEKGAYTGASERKAGRFERANGGTLFLDEIAELPTQNHATLLRVLQEREFERVGGSQLIKVDINLIAATNRDLPLEVHDGRFRRDLYDRLCGYLIRTPALRDHPTDIPILIRHYFPYVEFQEEALELLCQYRWPGNVRQLRSMVKRLAGKAGRGRIITIDQVYREIDHESKSVLTKRKTECLPVIREDEPLKEFLCRFVLGIYEIERARLGTHSAVAQQLGMKRTTLYDWLAWARQHNAK